MRAAAPAGSATPILGVARVVRAVRVVGVVGVLGVLGGAGILAAMTACGASYQSMYDGDVRFEHCYRLDDDPAVPIRHKWSCWRDWNRAYTYGQSRERVEYALARERTLASARGAAITSGGSERRPATGGAIACPMPTNAFAPPPSTLRPPDGGSSSPTTMPSGASLVSTSSSSAPAASGAPSGANGAPGVANSAPGVANSAGATASAAPQPPSAVCGDGCGRQWTRCGESCAAPASSTCRPTCDERYRACMRRCF